jgi:hypothetical protein
MNAASGSIATTRLGCALGTQSFGFYPLRSTQCPIVGWQTNIPGLGHRLGVSGVPRARCRLLSAGLVRLFFSYRAAQQTRHFLFEAIEYRSW